jgi:hypothetical protein
LDLDYQVNNGIADSRKKQQSSSVDIGNNGSYLVNSEWTTVSWSQPTTEFVIKHSEKYVGKWEITKGMFVYRHHKTKYSHKIFSRDFALVLNGMTKFNYIMENVNERAYVMGGEVSP